MIPPSTFLVLYAIMTGESVARMLAAGIIPGVLSAIAHVAYIMIAGQRQIVRQDAILQEAVDAAHTVASARSDERTKTPSSVTLPAAPDTAAVRGVYGLSARDLPWRGLTAGKSSGTASETRCSTLLRRRRWCS